jgi:glycerol-3-phosphate acyltransferase PlsY
MSTIDITLVAVAYLFGSISTAIIVCRLMGLPDPRTQGSKNPGATNVLRLGGKKAAGLTLLGDFLKGLIPVLIAQALSDDPQLLALVALAAFLGHLYPVFFGFRGGKGVATALGVLLGLSWLVAVVCLATWLVMAKLFRISSLSALTAATLSPLYAWLLTPHREFVIMLLAMSALLIWRHRSNIRNLLAGNEGKIGQKG